jgi:hypothetical protein
MESTFYDTVVRRVFRGLLEQFPRWCIRSYHRRAWKPGSFAMALGSVPQKTEESCPEYTLVSEKVVYIVVGKRSSQFMPLAEIIQFHLLKNELLVRVDDEKRESRFSIKEMTLRSDWERDQALRGKQLELRLQAERNELRRQELKQELKTVADDHNSR